MCQIIIIFDDDVVIALLFVVVMVNFTNIFPLASAYEISHFNSNAKAWNRIVPVKFSMSEMAATMKWKSLCETCLTHLIIISAGRMREVMLSSSFFGNLSVCLNYLWYRAAPQPNLHGKFGNRLHCRREWREDIHLCLILLAFIQRTHSTAKPKRQ